MDHESQIGATKIMDHESQIGGINNECIKNR